MQAPKKIAVAGATGRVGRHVVDVLVERGHAVVPMSRASGVDVVSGQGLDDALAGVDCIIDAASGHSPEEAAATAFFTASARNLQAAGERAGVRRLVVVSIIGTDRFSGGYNAAKMAHERGVRSGPVPVRIVRAAQFHEFIPEFVSWGTQGDTAYVPNMRTQVVAARTVAEVLVDEATQDVEAAAGASFVEVAGPRPENLVDLATLLAGRRGHPLKVEGVSDPADPNHALYASGALLPGAGAILGGPTFEEWLDAVS